MVGRTGRLVLKEAMIKHLLSPARIASLIAFAVPALALSGAYASQYFWGLAPCHLCLEQRWPHFVALAFGLAALGFGSESLMGRALIAIAAGGIATSGGIAVFHAGVEAGWWEYVAPCTSTLTGSGSALENIMSAPLVRCDEVAFRFLGVSMAGWNAIVSLAAATAIMGLLVTTFRSAHQNKVSNASIA